MPAWSKILLDFMKASKSFRSEFNRQLRQQLLDAVDFNIEDEQFSVAIDSDVQKSDQLPGVFYIDCDFIFPNIFGYPAKIGWRCLKHIHNKFDITKEIPNDCQYEFFWIQYPIHELNDYKNGVLDGFDPKSLIQAKWPDLRLFIQFNHTSQDVEISKIERQIVEWVETYNRENINSNVIHYVGDIISDTDGVAIIHIDFGSAPIIASNLLLEELKKNNDIINAYYD